MWLAKSSPYSKSNSGTELFSAAIANGSPTRLASRATAAPFSSSTSAPTVPRRAGLGGGQQPVQDDALRLADALALRGRRRPRDPEQLRLERRAVIEGEDVQRPV
jgi:hypothetical protein